MAIAISRSLRSKFGARTTPANASEGFLKLAMAFDTVRMGCFTASRRENLDVSLTRVGLPGKEINVLKTHSLIAITKIYIRVVLLGKKDKAIYAFFSYSYI